MIQRFAISLLILFLPSQLWSFYYAPQLLSIPPEQLEPYRQRHHLSKSFSSLFERARKAYLSLDFDRAEQVYNTLLLINSRDLIAMDRLSQVYLKQAHYAKAIAVSNRCLEVDPFYAPALHQLSKIHLYKGEYKKSVRYAKALIESGRAYVETYLLLLHSLFSLSQTDNLVAVANLAIEAGANHPQFRFLPLFLKTLKGDKKRAIKIMKPFFQDFREDPDLVLYQYILAKYHGDSPKAREALETISKRSFPDSVSAYLFLSLAMKEIGQVTKQPLLLTDAVELCKLALKDAPKFLLPYRIALEILQHNQNHLAILQLTARGLVAAPYFRFLLERQGEAAFFAGKPEISKKALKIAVEQESRDPDLLGYLGILLAQNKDEMEDGLRTADIALSLDPGNAYAQTALGIYYLNRGEPLRAKIPFQQAIRKPLPIPLPYEFLIKILRGAGEWRSAFKIAKEARLLHKTESLQVHAVEIASHLKQHPECVSFGKEALRQFPNNPLFPLLIAKSLRAMGKYNEALRALDVLKPGPGSGQEINLLYLQLLLDRKLYFEANEKLKVLLSVEPRNVSYKAFQAQYHYDRGEYRKALPGYENLLKLTGSKSWLTHIGWIKFLLMQRKGAIKDLKTASIQGDKENRALAAYRLGLIYSLATNQRRESSGSYTRAFELIPRLKEAHEDHLLVLELRRTSKDKNIIRKNLELYLE
jgi:tetratricopeptide (TPR) repeat protein